MHTIDQIQHHIVEIKKIFRSYDLECTRSCALEHLNNFEQSVSRRIKHPPLLAVVNWYKNILLQHATKFPRAEQLLDEAMDILESLPEPVYKKWKLKTCLSLGYVHRAQWNFLDAESYLTDALDIARSTPELAKYTGEIYALLSKVNLALSRHHRAKQYVQKETDICRQNHLSDPANESLASSYANALINYSRTNRLVDLVDRQSADSLNEAIRISSQLSSSKFHLLSLLEKAEFQFITNQADAALETVLDLEPALFKLDMFRESLQAGLLIAKIFRKVHDYEEAEHKLNQLIALASSHRWTMTRLMADLYFELGAVFYAVNEEAKAYEYYRKSAKIGMVLGIKDIIIRAFDNARIIDRYKAQELLTSDLVYQDADFSKNRMGRTISPFKAERAKIKLYASTLFIDIVDFSQMMRKSDESLTVKMIDELIDRMYLIIYQHDGYIDKFLGDGFMAIFEHGNAISAGKALKAIKAGINIQRALKHKNRKLKKVYGVKKNICVRIGISTGEIYAMILGNYIKTEFTYLGNSVNLASKLESHAGNECMLIDENTFNLTQERIISQDETITIAGMGAVMAHRVLRLTRTNERAGES